MNILKDVLVFWKETWRESPAVFAAEMVGAVTSMAAAILLSTQAAPPLIAVFILYLVGSVCLLGVSYWRRASWMLVMFTFFTVFNLVGLVNHAS